LTRVEQVVEGVTLEGVVVKLGTVRVTGFPVYLSSSVDLSRCHESSR
jgi:phage head maturation protease